RERSQAAERAAPRAAAGPHNRGSAPVWPEPWFRDSEMPDNRPVSPGKVGRVHGNAASDTVADAPKVLQTRISGIPPETGSPTLVRPAFPEARRSSGVFRDQPAHGLRRARPRALRGAAAATGPYADRAGSGTAPAGE